MRLFSPTVATLFILFLTTSSCQKSAQRPANKATKSEQTKEALTQLNKKAILQEDSLITNWITAQSIPFQHTQEGIWIAKSTTATPLAQRSEIFLTYQAYNLQNRLLDSGEKRIHFKKKEIPIGLEKGLKYFNIGEKGTIVIPWYLAYGMLGNKKIPPYTSLKYQIELQK